MIKYDMPDAEYRAAPGLSYSFLKEVKRSPLHARALLDSPRVETEAMRIGKLAHLAVQNYQEFFASTVVAPSVDRRTKAGKAEYEAFVDASVGKQVISADDHTDISGMRDSIMSNTDAAGCLGSASGYEVSAFYDCKEFTLKGRYDWLDEDNCRIIDLKTSQDASADSFERDCWNFSYYMQAGLYTSLAERHFGVPFDFVFIVVEKKPPYACAVYFADLDMILRGRDDVNECIKRWRAAEISGVYNGYKTRSISLPKWTEARHV